MSTVFTQIVLRNIPAYIIAEDDDYLAFLDVSPNALGHTLVIPKQEVDKITDLDDKTYLGLFAFAKKVAISIEKVITCERVGMAVVGLDVPHVHLHLIPINNIEDINFSNKVKVSEKEMEDAQQKISYMYKELYSE